MRLDMTFEESNQRIDVQFAEVQTASDGGFERGYEQGYTEGNENGYKDGYSEAQEETASLFGIQNEVTGKGLVTLDYVNENEHNVEVKLSSDTVTDFSGCIVQITDESETVVATYTANADGTVDGVTSISPTMNIICAGVDISAKYYCMQDVEWQRFWDSYQDYGQRVNYECAFRGVGWTDKTLKPKYKITPTIATAICSSSLITKVSTDIFDFSKTTTFYNAFEMSKNLMEVTVNDMSLATNANNMFYYLPKIQKINLGSINPSCSFNNAFYICPVVDFECSGSFGKSVSFQYSSLLTNESVQSIIDGLADLTGQATQTLTLHADVKAKLTEEQIATITSKNWTLA